MAIASITDGMVHLVEDLLDLLLESHVQHPIGLVQDEEARGVETERPLAQVIQDASGRPDDDVRPLLEPVDLPGHRVAAVDRQDPHARSLAEAAELVRHLHAQLARRAEDERLHAGHRRVDLLDDRDAEGGRLAGAGARLDDQIAAGPG